MKSHMNLNMKTCGRFGVAGGADPDEKRGTQQKTWGGKAQTRRRGHAVQEQKSGRASHTGTLESPTKLLPYTLHRQRTYTAPRSLPQNLELSKYSNSLFKLSTHGPSNLQTLA